MKQKMMSRNFFDRNSGMYTIQWSLFTLNKMACKVFFSSCLKVTARCFFLPEPSNQIRFMPI